MPYVLTILGVKVPLGLKTTFFLHFRQIIGVHTVIRNRNTPRDEFIFYSKRLIRLVSFKVGLVATLGKLSFMFLFVPFCYFYTGSPRYMRSFYLRFRVYAIRKWPFYWNLTSNLQSSLVFLYANSLYASLFLESLSVEYNEVHLYF